MDRFTVLMALCLLAVPVQAHLLNMTRVAVTIDEQGIVSASVDVDLTKEAGGGEAYYAFSQIPATLTDARFASLVNRLEAASVFMLGERRVPVQVTQVALPDAPKADFTSGLAWPMTRFTLHGQLPDNFTAQALHVMFADSFKFEEPVAVTITYTATQTSLSRWLVRNQFSPSFTFNRSAPTPSVNGESVAMWLSYMKQGILHIVPKGWDHALFVLGLLLGVTSLRQLILLITGFTLAHTLTLALATYGAVVVSAHVIEPLIALSIVWIGAENVWVKPKLPWRFIVVVGFGLLHGLGFAEALRALGIPSSDYIGALVSFNVGVELAQLGLIGVVWVVVRRWRYQPYWFSRMVKPGSLFIAGLALYWFIQRTLF
ncbi:HupE/UreJ family protein [Alteromonas gilva]|uniref:HupE/UreJ family protein n=1 Tax=Alteromonas gilva TaxID=2987522 RepID=A0ABT5L183_9ALTE|nr:HupE/UreJ family protein [Alteromonas gilva]MDC8830790.1 HupE/UreJ family protein [Alteromonas gilva]